MAVSACFRAGQSVMHRAVISGYYLEFIFERAGL